MEILVCVKRYILAGSTFVLNEDSTEIDAKHLGYTLAPHEEVAVEQAIRFVEEFGGSTTVLSLGQPEVEEQLREQLAIGADRGIILATDGSEWDALVSYPVHKKVTLTAKVARYEARRGNTDD